MRSIKNYRRIRAKKTLSILRKDLGNITPELMIYQLS